VVAAVPVDLQPDTAVVAAVPVDLQPDTVVAAAVPVDLQPDTVVAAAVPVDLLPDTAVVRQRAPLRRVENQERSFFRLPKSVESADLGPREAEQGPVRWVYEAVRPEPLDQQLAELAEPDCSSAGLVCQVE
jgi:hypothetical protein